ncbi:MAG: hypothetical protein FJY75_10645, partial [Candidatus Eisenbacteria bacterium]|nr:hypothetical protein [Candidatus Eisenbacteria bacterium]
MDGIGRRRFACSRGALRMGCVMWLSWAMLHGAAPLARAGGAGEPAQFPDYWGESAFLVDAPGSSNSLGAGFFNPAAWPMRGRGGLLLAWDDPAARRPAPCAGDTIAPPPAFTGSWLGVASVGGLAFGARSFLHDGPDGEVLAWDEYT